MKPKISVVIPAYNRPELLEKTISAIENQSLKKNDFECIIVYGNDQRVKEICEKKAKNSKLFNCFQAESESPSKKRNIGIQNSHGEIIAFTDDDCIPDKNWLDEIIKKFDEDKKIVCVEGLTYTEGKKQLYSNAPVNEKGGLFPTCNLSFRKSVLEKIGGFDEAYHFFREDSDIAFRAMEFGKIIFCESARVFHPQRKVPLTRPFDTLWLIKEEVRIFKKMPEKCKKIFAEYYSSTAKSLGIFYLTLILGVAVLPIIIDVLFETEQAFEISLTIFFFLYFVATFVALREIRKNKFSVFEFFAYSVFFFMKWLAMPFFLIYYWIVVK